MSFKHWMLTNEFAISCYMETYRVIPQHGIPIYMYIYMYIWIPTDVGMTIPQYGCNPAVDHGILGWLIYDYPWTPQLFSCLSWLDSDMS